MNITEKISPSGFLKHYINYASYLTDAPPEFHLMTGLALLSVSAGNSITFRGFGGEEQWCNLYLLIIAPSGQFRKTTSLSIGKRILSKANKELILPNETTRERFLTELKDRPNSILFIPEFAALLSLWGREYMGGMKEIITELYDPTAAYTRLTMKNEKITISRPSLTIVAATTADWLVERLTQGDLMGGLMGRFLTCPSGPKIRWQGLPERPDDILEDELADYLTGIHSIDRAKVNMEPVRDDFNKWLKDTEQSASLKFGHEMSGFISRMGNHTLKIATLLLLSQMGPAEKYEMDSVNISMAMTIMDYLLERLQELSQTTLTTSKTEHDMQKLLGKIRKDGGISHRDLLKQSHMKAREFETYISTLVQRGEVKSLQRKTGGRQAHIYEIANEGE
jgi:hypothetical protein